MPIDLQKLKEFSERAKTGATTPVITNVREPADTRLGYQKAGSKVLGGVLRIIDQIERPYYGIMNFAKYGFFENKGQSGEQALLEAMKGFGRGVSLKEKSEFSDVLTSAGWQPTSVVGKVSKAGVSFAGAVLLDPTTYFTLGAGKGLTLAGKPLTKIGESLFLKKLTKYTGTKFSTLADLAKLSDKFDQKTYEKAVKFTLRVANGNPDLYYNKTALRFLGAEVPKVGDAFNGMSRVFNRALKPILDTRIGRTVESGGRQVAGTIGDLFSPGYSIRNSRKYTMEQKTDLLAGFESDRVKKAWLKTQDLNYVQHLFNKVLTKNQRKQVAYNIEKFLPVEAGGVKDFKLEDIADLKVRKVVSVFQPKMKEVWEAQVASGARKPGDKLGLGYIKRYAKKFSDWTDYNRSAFESRQLGKPTIEQTKQLYKEKKIDYILEDDAAKLMLRTMDESNSLILRKNTIDRLEKGGFLTLAKEAGTPAGEKAAPGMIREPFFGKIYEGAPEVIKEIKRINPMLEDKGIKKFLNLYDGVQNAWKLSVTSWWPSFHARNFFSNIFLGYLAGNTSVNSYRLAGKVQIYGWNVARGKTPADEVVKVGLRKFKLSELSQIVGENGITGTGWMGGDIAQRLTLDVKSKLWQAPRKIGTAVENNARIALFVQRLGKGDDVLSAKKLVNKFLFDYGDLTVAEREVFKRAAPFYTWMRKNIPLQFEQMIKQPGKYTGTVHAQKAIESMTAAQEEQFLPDWMKQEEMYVRLPNQKYWNPDLPFQDLAKLTLSNRGMKELINPITPLVKGAFEVAGNIDYFRGKDLADARLPQSKFLRNKIVQEIKNNVRFNAMYNKATDDQRSRLDKFLNILFGINITPFDVQKGRQYYYQRKTGERRALQREKMKKK